MAFDLKNWGAVVLAAGKGTRLNCVDRPKVMLELGGRPIVSYIVATLKKLGFAPERICLVVGFHEEVVRAYFGPSVSYASQTEQKGTAHAAYAGMRALPPDIEHVLVVNGDDSAFYRGATLGNLMREHVEKRAVVTLLSAETENNTGKIVRHADGKIEIVEKEQLTEEQKKIKEISTGTFCFDRAWFEKMFPQMPVIPKLGEYGLPTAFMTAVAAGERARVVKLADPSEWCGINTPEELERANQRLQKYL